MAKAFSTGAAAIGAALALAEPAQAAMDCWDEQGRAAARIRDLQSRLMVATLRCRALGIDVLDRYNEFARVNRATLQEANGAIKARFASGYGSTGEAFYDRFTTALANAYGADGTDPGVCEQTAAAADEGAAAAGDPAKLILLAERIGPTPELPGGACPVTLSAR